jgi:hypothetical protein
MVDQLVPRQGMKPTAHPAHGCAAILESAISRLYTYRHELLYSVGGDLLQQRLRASVVQNPQPAGHLVSYLTMLDWYRFAVFEPPEPVVVVNHHAGEYALAAR